MMTWRRRVLAGAMCAATLTFAACAGAGAGDSAAPVGDPVPGGPATVLSINEPRSLDPAIMLNAWAYNAVLGNALYGTLMVNDPKTGEIGYRMATGFETEDEGKTFELTLRDGLTFSDGTPLNAEAVKYNWDRIRDPATGSASIRDAGVIEATEVVDDRTLKVTLAAPIPNYAQSVVTGSLNWIAAPAALKQGQRAFDDRPVGAGPFTLKSWTRQGNIELVKNPRYWDAPKPYLDTLVVRAVPDSTQRLNTLLSGGANVAVDTNWQTIDEARTKGLAVDLMPMSGGQGLTLNTRQAPFDDVRARKAVAAALDLNAVDLAVYNGKGEIPTTLFRKESPFHADVRLTKPDKKTAQKLFDELAAAGKPVSFTFTSYPTPEAKGVAESIQAQLSAFRNVTVKVKTVDLAETASIYSSHDFDMIISSALVVDPEPQLWNVLHGKSRANVSGIDDDRLNQALDEGRRETDPGKRKQAYDVVQERLAELVPVIFYTRASPAVETAGDTHGARQYGFGSVLPEELWVQH